MMGTMSACMKSRDFGHVTHSRHRTVNRALHLTRVTWSVMKKPSQAGRPRLLTSLDAYTRYSLHYGMLMLAIEKTLRKRGFMCEKVVRPANATRRFVMVIKSISQKNFTLISLFSWMNQPAIG
ncbi:hypothetical protein BDR07DRAFT_1412560 [Suillus spraguei]|nr:hypothetical protein BDR07DRAFT_1412560 [Suillus spraguei]